MEESLYKNKLKDIPNVELNFNEIDRVINKKHKFLKNSRVSFERGSKINPTKRETISYVDLEIETFKEVSEIFMGYEEMFKGQLNCSRWISN